MYTLQGKLFQTPVNSQVFIFSARPMSDPCQTHVSPSTAVHLSNQNDELVQPLQDNGMVITLHSEAWQQLTLTSSQHQAVTSIPASSCQLRQPSTYFRGFYFEGCGWECCSLDMVGLGVQWNVGMLAMSVLPSMFCMFVGNLGAFFTDQP